MTEQTFEQGWAARPFKEQFPYLSEMDAAHLDAINKAITKLRMADMLTDSQLTTLRTKKFPKEVSRVLDQYSLEDKE